MTRSLALLLIAVLAACSSGSDDPEPPAVQGDRCHGVEYADVQGTPPEVARPPVRSYPVADAVCAAYWIPEVDDGFVPQSLEIDGTTAYVGGYGWVPRRTERACQIAKIDLESGLTTAFVPRFEAPIYGPEPTYCRHGGGLALTDEGLWVAEFERLWLLDPDRLGQGDPVLRVWRIERPVLGSTMLVDGDRIALARYRREGRGRLWWFDLDALLAPGVTVVADPVARRLVPMRLQGMTAEDGGVWLNSSSTHCAELRSPGRRPIPFVPGSEDLELTDRDIWTVSEAGTQPYLDPNEEVVPMLLRLDRRAVLAQEESDCGWDQQDP